MKEIKDLTSSLDLGELVTLTKLTSGGDSTSFDIETSTGQFILRTGGRRVNYDVEHAVLVLARQVSDKVPTSVAASIDTKKYPFSFSLQKKLSGVELESLAQPHWPPILEQVGTELAKIYAIKIAGYGQLDPEIYREAGELEGKHRSWQNFLLDYFTSHLAELEVRLREDTDSDFAGSKLSTKQRRQVIEIYQSFDEVGARVREVVWPHKASLLHGDLHGEHFLVGDNQLVGIIDFNKTFVGDPLFDIAYFSVMPGGELYSHLMRTSGVKMDKERFSLYRLIISIVKIHTRHIRFDYLHEYSEILDIAISELQK